MIRWFADLPIERKLRVVIMVPATVAFAIALAMHVATNLLHLRDDMLRRGSRVARVRAQRGVVDRGHPRMLREPRRQVGRGLARLPLP